jgi:hypothetical protein
MASQRRGGRLTSFHSQNNLNLIETTGHLFPDGRSLSLLKNCATSELELLFSDDENFEIARRVEIDGRVYAPPSLDPSVLDAVTLPTSSSDYESTEQLFSAIEKTFTDRGFPHEVTFPTASFVFGTFFPECLPSLCLMVTGPRPEGRLFLRLLTCVVRHALLLVELNVATFCNIPMVLKPTLVVDHEKPGQAVCRLLAASETPGAFLARKGKFTEISSARAIYVGRMPSRFSLGEMTIRINLQPSHGQRLHLERIAQDQIVSEFQPKLLVYRARNIRKVSSSDFDVPEFDSPQRMLVRSLGRCIVDAPKIQARLVSLFAAQQEMGRTDRWVDPQCVALESMLFHCHSGKDITNGRLRILSVATTAETILKGRGEDQQVTPKALGSTLRDLGFADRRNGDGYYIEITNEVRRKIHASARALSVPAMRQPVVGCKECVETFESGALPTHATEIK